MNSTGLFEAFKEKTVLVIGDVMIDSYIFGTKSIIQGTPVVSQKRKEKRLGGAANVALNVQALGATSILCSVVGDDHDGQTFERLLDYQGMPNKGIIRSQNRKTTNKLRIHTGSQPLLRVDSEDVHPLVDLDRKALLNHIRDLIKESDLIIFEDYDKGTIHAEIISETIQMAKTQEIPVVVDPKHTNFLAYKDVSLIKPSVEELEKFIGNSIDLSNQSLLGEAISKLGETLNVQNLLVSCDSGDIYYHSNRTANLYPSGHTGVSDMSGVGNAVISVAGLGLTVGLQPEAIAELCKLAAEIVAKYTGVVPLSGDQFFKEANSNQILEKYL